MITRYTVYELDAADGIRAYAVFDRLQQARAYVRDLGIAAVIERDKFERGYDGHTDWLMDPAFPPRRYAAKPSALPGRLP